ncbi:Holliday junction branch migration protein RuvA [Pacificimonas sp. WHA3]|uniref:Holliday junction branch migration complex subunit RuvA n=1 Tax=Pacificimonas pallii TaxID=2827236 RepID=A0ABS6SC95_9SPHN|nr:Holliday junction branch migration protein RuvA [Pacificimonas pallii]MBV7256040.1 Holliday junction branch migration protein RuvA [Pacificimonas pallii]
MIAKLTGIVDTLTADSVILDVNGVGYLVSASSRTIDELAHGHAAALLIETVIREDAFQLYGFRDADEQGWFRLLTGVQGVGARVGLAILSTLGPGELQAAIANGDKAMVARTPGVGPKLAQRLVSELADKVVPGMGVTAGAANLPGGGGAAAAGSAAAEAQSALLNLGFKPAQAAKVVAAAVEELGADAAVEAIVGLALKKAAR